MTISEPPRGFITKTTERGVDETVRLLEQLVRERDLTLFTVIDHSGEARRHGLELRPTKVVLFGSPEAGTPVMVLEPLVALDLPLKVLIYEDGPVTNICYHSPQALAERYHLTDGLAARLAAIDGITDQLTER